MEALDDYLRSFRKFGCSVYLATQHLYLTPEMRASIFGNCERFVCFATSRHDATFLGTEFGEPESKLISRLLPDLPVGNAVLKSRGRPPLMLRAEASKIRPTKEVVLAGRSRCSATGQSREAIEADMRQRLSVGRSLVAVPQVVARGRRAIAAASELPEGYDE